MSARKKKKTVRTVTAKEALRLGAELARGKKVGRGLVFTGPTISLGKKGK